MGRTILFYDPSFPFNGNRPNDSFLKQIGQHFEITNVNELKERLQDKDITGFINLHGPYFPKGVWSSILLYLQSGNGFVHLGGVPFRIPCYLEDGEWKPEREQTIYHRQLNIHEVLPVKPNPVDHLEHNKDIPVFKDCEQLLTVEPTYNFVLHVSKASHTEKEMGSSGPMDARIYPLLKGISKSGREVASPAVLIENTKGNFPGGRWVFLNQTVQDSFWNKQGSVALNNWATFTSRGVTEMWPKTNYATYEPGERPTFAIQLQTTGPAEKCDWHLNITISKDNHEMTSIKLNAEATSELQILRFTPEIDIEPGFYSISCTAESDQGETRTLRQGFWGMDRELLESGTPLTYDRDYFRKDGRPFPIVGMTYMTSDVARYYFFLPNPQVWDKDFAQMKRAGINFVRTGIWTGWRNMMFIDGHPSEDVLRAIDAFILTAKKHDIEVSFNFFSFTPETWEGTNPYLDPRSVGAQKRFVTAIVSRHAQTTNVQWDLINEPSMFDPDRVFAGPRSAHDQFEKAAYIKWLKEKYDDVRKLQERWHKTEQQLPSFEAVTLPEPKEVNGHIQDMITGKIGLMWIDYTLFTMDMHNQWVKIISDSIKKINTHQLITVGQDEALAAQRPSPFFYAEAVDYTSNHSWWLMDQLLWDGIFAKTPNKPNLIQETGIMYVEQPDGFAKRSEKELRNILERKYAYAFSTGSAGAVQWLWNTNYYMNNANESNIGALRADGTEKPETNVSYDFGSFINDTSDLFEDREVEDIAVVFPYSNDFSNRRLAFDATTKLTRTLAYDMKTPFRALGEYHLDSLKDHPPRLIIVPSAHHFNSRALENILDVVKEYGMTLLFTGPVNLDEYWHKTARMSHLIGPTAMENIVREEMLVLNDQHIPVSFGDKRIAEVVKEVPVNEEKPTAVKEFRHGNGFIIWSPLPIELNESKEPLMALYRHAMNQAGLSEHLKWYKGDIPGVYGRKLPFRNGSLFIFVSEFSQDTPVKVMDPATGTTYTFLLESERSVLFATNHSGIIESIYRENEVHVDTKEETLT